MNTTIFSGKIKPVPHFRANYCTTFAKKLIPGRSLQAVGSDAISLARDLNLSTCNHDKASALVFKDAHF